MALDISIKTVNNPLEKENIVEDKNINQSRSGGLSLRILAVNVVAPMILVLGFLYMGQYRESLIMAELDTMRIKAQLFASAVAEGSVDFVGNNSNLMDKGRALRMVERLSKEARGEASGDAKLFDANGHLIGESVHSFVIDNKSSSISIDQLPDSDINFAVMLQYLGTRMMELVPDKLALEPYPHSDSKNIKKYPDARNAITGLVSATAWEDKDEKIILSASAPIKKNGNISAGNILGVILLTQDGSDIEIAMAKVRFDVLTVFIGALSITIFLSIYLAGTIGRPLRRLSIAAEEVRKSKKRHVNIPDMSSRRDEIGDLSISLREMTQALWDRMDNIESFAADVSHEIKNPLTSMRSAVETISKVKKKTDRDKLLEVLNHDVQRLDRLISDISNASRLDAELSREDFGGVNLGNLLTQIANNYLRSLEGDKNSPVINVSIPGETSFIVKGNEGRLAQIFENLISNAISFSPPKGEIEISLKKFKNSIIIKVTDEGFGIPAGKLKNVFERFYSERPKHESYGNHSGLGLSIAKQIVETHDGTISAENIKNKSGKVIGACFKVTLNAV